MTLIRLAVSAIYGWLFCQASGWIDALLGTQISSFEDLWLVATGCIFAVVQGLFLRASSQLRKQNTRELAAWRAAGYADPDAISRNAFTAHVGEGRGSAFMLRGDIIVTNRHVAKEASGGILRLENIHGTDVDARVTHLAREGEPDLAFARLSYKRIMAAGLPLATEEPKKGDKLLIIGHPLGRPQGYQSVVTVNDIGTYGATNRRHKLSKFTMLMALPGVVIAVLLGAGLASKTSNSIVYAYKGDTAGGNSGSPVVNTKGEVVGVHFAGTGFYFFARERQGVCVSLGDLKSALYRSGLAQPYTLPQNGPSGI